MNYKVPFVDYPTHYRRMESEIDAAIKKVLTGGDFILRQQLRDFESNVASFLGVDYAVGVNSGTDAMHLSLLAAGLGQGDEVITVAHTFVATVAVIVHCGATPILVDVDEDFNMDVEQLERAISPRTKAIIPVHLNGRLCNMEKLMAIARSHNLWVIEDAAQALGAEFDGQKAGSFGLTGCFSFYPAKILGGVGDGGMVTTNSEEIAERLDNLQAAILDVKLKHLPDWIERRRELASLYEKGLSDLPQIKTPPPPRQGRYFDVFTNYVVRAEKRDKLASYLKECGIEVLISWPKPMHHHEALGLKHFHLPVTEQLSIEVLSLPLNTEISNEQAEFVIESIRNFYQRG